MKQKFVNLIRKSKENLLKMSEISLWLDTYDDIFSDFDPRPYSERSLSDDFLREAKKASIDKVSGMIELKFLVPSEQRNKTKEEIIKQRLRNHFNKHYRRLKNEAKKTIRGGFLMLLTGILLMFIATFIFYTQQTEKNLFVSFLIILLEPAGWFLFWEGSSQVFLDPEKIKPNLIFYKKMSKCEIYFISY